MSDEYIFCDKQIFNKITKYCSTHNTIADSFINEFKLYKLLTNYIRDIIGKVPLALATLYNILRPVCEYRQVNNYMFLKHGITRDCTFQLYFSNNWSLFKIEGDTSKINMKNKKYNRMRDKFLQLLSK